jgi:decaprenyl-phosphate phosphoribosyltransferase
MRAPATLTAGLRIPALSALIALARPRQWIKNGVVIGAPAAAGVLTHSAALLRVGLAFAAFCLLASGTYFLNDVADAASDRRHPSKRARPVAAGTVTPRLAVVAGTMLLLAGLCLCALIGPAMVVVGAAYAALTTAYSLVLKRVPVLELGVVTTGFVLRAVGGGVAAGVSISRWFLLVVSFGALFVVAGKRYGERISLGDYATRLRPALGVYDPRLLRGLATLAAAGSVVAYCVWAFGHSSEELPMAFSATSIVPFALGAARYAHLLGSGSGSAPEEVLLHDRPLQLLALIWATVFASGVYLTDL